MRFERSTLRRRVFGVAGLVVMIVLAWAAWGSYRKEFTAFVPVTLHADRAGLLMDPGAEVRLQGVSVGEVRSVNPDKGGARIEIALKPGAVDNIPAGTTAEIVPTTVFGAKYVSLTAAHGPVTMAIRAGDSIETAHVTAELNDVFLGLQDVLTTVQPAKLNATLGSIAATLDRRGSKLGSYVNQLDTYLAQLNPHIATIKDDLHRSASVVNTYADAANDLIAIADHADTTSITLTRSAAMLHTTLLSFTRAADDGADFVNRVGEPLVTAADVLNPTLRLGAVYSPMLTCTVKGLNETRKRLEHAQGNQLPGVQLLISLLPSQQGYQYPRDLPKLVTGVGPHCFDLPVVPAGVVPPRVRFDDNGSYVYARPDDALTIPFKPVSVVPGLGLLPTQQQPGAPVTGGNR